RVALVAGNSAEFPIAVYAVNYLGAIIVPVNFRLAAGEIAFILGDCEPTVVITDAAHTEVARTAVAESDRQAELVGLSDLTAPGRHDEIPDPVLCDTDDDQAIMYTSGTTGRPKGAVLTYANFLG